MTTQHVPQRGQHGRSGSRLDGILLVILIVLFVILVGLLAWLIRSNFVSKPLPTLVPSVTSAGVAVEPLVQITPGTGTQGTLITVQGQGWQPGDQLIVCLDDLGDEAAPLIFTETVVNAAGEFSAAFTFPIGVQWLSLPDIPVVVESKTSHEKQSAVFRLVENTPTPSSTTVQPFATPTSPTATPACRYSMRFVADISIPDDTAVPAGAGFIKTWRIQNNGTCAWPAGTSWVFASGQQMGGPDTVSVSATNPGETADVSVHLVAPTTPGRYTGYWTLRLPTGGTVDQRYFVRIVVPTPTLTPTPVTPTLTPTPVTPTPTSAPATPTPVILNWRGEYFNNATLAGTPALVRDDTAVIFNWGTGAPASSLPADNFSVRWTRTFSFSEGNYRFHTTMDDGLRLYIDNILIIDEWRDASYREVTADLWLAAGNHEFRIEYYEHLGEARVQVWWDALTEFSGWRGEYWTNKNLAGLPALVRNDAKIEFDWGDAAPASGLPADQFSVRWTQTIDFEPGTYKLFAVADDGVRVYVDTETVIDQWHLSGGDHTYLAQIALAGTHTIIVEYYDEHIAARIHFWYEQSED